MGNYFAPPDPLLPSESPKLISAQVKGLRSTTVPIPISYQVIIFYNYVGTLLAHYLKFFVYLCRHNYKSYFADNLLNKLYYSIYLIYGTYIKLIGRYA